MSNENIMQFLVIARVVEGISIEQVLPHVEAEAEAIWQNYLDQTLRSIYYIADMSGAVLMCEASNLEVIQEMTEERQRAEGSYAEGKKFFKSPQPLSFQAPEF
ncbi:MAG: hypothetical protein PUP92_24840, partial [Rhizonema sp. PD38]|nr:hypothetical protein [Rhizonema sp. PD38]